MRHKVAGRQLVGGSSHKKAVFRNLVTSLLNHGKITTTEAKAKEIRGLAEKMITLGKKHSLASRRSALSYVLDSKAVDKLFDEYAVRYVDRPGGYTRIVKLGPRLGDGAPIVKIELVE
ncbi:MAG: 50S ribosomal protein L17 [Chloroflexi bacterium]|nr:50S ribosomal protein L17 [Chloroflexota bacterium]